MAEPEKRSTRLLQLVLVLVMLAGTGLGIATLFRRPEPPARPPEPSASQLEAERRAAEIQLSAALSARNAPPVRVTPHPSSSAPCTCEPGDPLCSCF